MKTKLIALAVCICGLAAAEETKKVEEVALSEVTRLKLENFDLKFKADLAAVNGLQARLAEYKKQYAELVKTACREAGLGDKCVTDGKTLKPEAEKPPKK